MKNLLFVLLSVAISNVLKAEVRLPAIFGDHMVVQQNATLKIWGWADTGEEVTITTNWGSAPVTAKTDNHANWSLQIETPGAGGPYEITITGSNTLVLHDVLIGEVWLGSGQSNMQWAASYGIDNGEQEVSEANFPEIRFFQVSRRAAESPQLDLEGHWEVCTPESMREFSAVGYFFARRLHRELSIPIGIIHSSWGGTPAETWIPPYQIESDPFLKSAAAMLEEVPWCPTSPGSTYHSMIAPLVPFPLAGVIWYQGEHNTRNHEAYSKMFATLIQSWRAIWDKDFPFYYVQIAPYKYDTPEAGVYVRDAQRRTLKIPKTGMVVISDIGNIEDIHPRNKHDVGLRLANWALSNTYGKEDIPYSGPLYDKMEVEGNKIRVYFNHSREGLVVRGKTLSHFEIAGSDGVFVPAKAKINGASVVVSSREVKEPTAVRFAWSNTAEPNLFNSHGLPASSFISTP
jgi:sialate O-acetylesterase